MKRFFVTVNDDLSRPIACETFETRKECEKWYCDNYKNDGFTFKIVTNTKFMAKSLSTIFEKQQFMRLNYVYQK